MNGTSWLLGHGYPWQSAVSDAESSVQRGIIASPRNGLSLAALPEGPLGLLSADGSLGRLVLPLGAAINADTLYLLSSDGRLVYRYDPVHETLTALDSVGAEGVGASPSQSVWREPRRFRDARGIASHDGALYVADVSQRRVQVFDLTTLALLRIHRGFVAPVDVAAGPDGVYILDRGRGRVYHASASSDRLTRVVDAPSSRQRCSRVAVDREGRIYVLESTPSGAWLTVHAGRGATRSEPERVRDPAEVRDRFDAPELTRDSNGGVLLSERVGDPCGWRRQRPDVRRYELGSFLYILDPESRQLRVHLKDGRLRHRFGPYGSHGAPAGLEARDLWSPVDLAIAGGVAFLLDEQNQIVYAHEPGSDVLRRHSAGTGDGAQRWQRLAHDGAGGLLLWSGGDGPVERLDRSGRVLEKVALQSVRDRFVRAPGAASLPTPGPMPRPARDGSIRRPTRLQPDTPERAHVTSGRWLSRWLDSDLYGCQWHLLELVLDELPAGARVLLKTRTSNEAQADAEVLASLGDAELAGSWQQTQVIRGAAQPSNEERGPRHHDLLVTSGPGRFLQLQLELECDGVASPRLGSLRIRFPRESLLTYLPAIYSAATEQREFLDQYLSILHTSWSAIETQLDTIDRYFDPETVPAESLGYLASWLGLTLEGTWTPSENRRLLQTLPRLLGLWGTPAGLEAWLRVYLAQLSGVDTEQIAAAGVPGIVENFMERRRLLLNVPGTATLGAAEGLWSPAVTRRFQVGVFDREGEIELVSIGAADTDVFRQHAHSFRVYVPAAWVRTPEAEALIRRAVDAQRPAHTSYELVLVEPRLRIGEQSTIGLDTVIGAATPAALGNTATPGAQSLQPRQRLGFDTGLACERADGSGTLERVLS